MVLRLKVIHLNGVTIVARKFQTQLIFPGLFDPASLLAFPYIAYTAITKANYLGIKYRHFYSLP
jgi:hypothetical protein